MKKILTLSILIFWMLTPINSFSQAPSILFTKCYGSTKHDAGQKIKQTNDGGYIFVGFCTSSDGDVIGWHPGYNSINEPESDIWVVKIDINGNIEWQKAIGGTSGEYCHDIIQTSDFGYILTGASYSTDGDLNTCHGESDLWVVKLNNDGSINWKKNFGGTNLEWGNQIKETASGDFFVLGSTKSMDGDVNGHIGTGYVDVWLLKLNNLGDIIWQKCYGGTNDDHARFFDFTLDGGLIISADTYSNNGDVTGNNGQSDGWLFKIDVSGNIIWQKCLGGYSFDYLAEVHSTIDGGYFVTGRSHSNNGVFSGNHGGTDAVAIKTDGVGNIEWLKTIGGSDDEHINNSIVTLDGNYVLVGKTYSNDFDVSGNHGDDDGWILKISANGVLEWQKCVGGTGEDALYGVIQDSNGSIVAIGSAETNDGDVIGNHSLYLDSWLVKFSGSAEINEVAENDISIFPNPVSTKLNFSTLKSAEDYSLFDVTGNRVMFGKIKDGINQIELETLANGIYYLKIDNSSEKVIVQN